MGLCTLTRAEREGARGSQKRLQRGLGCRLYRLCTPYHPLQAKIKAMLQELRVDKSLNIKPLQLCSDSMKLVHVMEQGHDLYTNNICQCRYLIKKLRATSAKHIFRE